MLNKLTSQISLLYLLLFMVSSPSAAQSDPEIRTSLNILPAKNTTSPQFNISYGLSVAPKTTVSLGTGFTFYNDPLSLVPIFVDFKYNLSRVPSLFFMSLKAGYNISILTDTDTQVDEHDGGLTFNPAIGTNIPTEFGFSLTIHAGYNLDRASFNRELWDNSTLETDITYKRLMAGIGFIF